MQRKRSPTNQNLIQVRLDRDVDVAHVRAKGSEMADWLRAVIATACRVERNGNIDFLQHDREVGAESVAAAADTVEDQPLDQVHTVNPESTLTPNYGGSE
jgi:hypothetical protein